MTAPEPGWAPVTEAEEGAAGWAAYGADCPECQAPRGFRCVYLTDLPEFNKWDYRVRSAHAAHRAGDPTTQPHQGRVHAWREAYRKEAHRAYREEKLPPSGPVLDKDALDVLCPVCSALPGRHCVYVAHVRVPATDEHGYVIHGGKSVIRHRKGSRTARVHKARREAYAAARMRRWRLDHPRAAGVIAAAPARAALAEFDRREYEALRDWLRAYGSILWEDSRPDGTVRGESYAMAEWGRLDG